MKKYIGPVITLIIIALAFIYFSEQKKIKDQSGKPIVKIGVSLPLTGNLGYAGQGMKAALEVLQEESNKKEYKKQYQFIIEDNGFDNKAAATITSKFINIDNVDAIIDFGSIIGQVSSPISQKAKMIHINVCSSDKSVAKGEYNFLITTTPEAETALLAKKISERYENVAIIAQNEVSSQITMNSLIKEFKDRGIKHTKYVVNQNEKDFRLILSKAEEQKPDVYVVFLYTPGLEIFVKQLKELGIQTPLTSTHFFANIEDYNLIEGSHYVDYASINPILKKEILAKTKGSNYEMCLAYIYEAGQFIMEAFDKNDDKEQAHKYIRNMIARSSEVTEQINQKEDTIFIISPSWRQIKNGKPELVQE